MVSAGVTDGAAVRLNGDFVAQEISEVDPYRVGDVPILSGANEVETFVHSESGATIRVRFRDCADPDHPILLFDETYEITNNTDEEGWVYLASFDG